MNANPKCKHCGARQSAHLEGGLCPPTHRETFKAEVVAPILTRGEENAGRPARSTAVAPLPPGERMIFVPATHYQDAERALADKLREVHAEFERLREEAENYRIERHEARVRAEAHAKELEAIAALVGADAHETVLAGVERFALNARERVIEALTKSTKKHGMHVCVNQGPFDAGHCPTCGFVFK